MTQAPYARLSRPFLAKFCVEGAGYETSGTIDSYWSMHTYTRGGYSVHSAVTGVKIWSNGQATLRGAVKWSSGTMV